jgi:hypothetical protein
MSYGPVPREREPHEGNRMVAFSLQQSDRERFAYLKRTTGLSVSELVRRFVRAYCARGESGTLPPCVPYIPPTRDRPIRGRETWPEDPSY